MDIKGFDNYWVTGGRNKIIPLKPYGIPGDEDHPVRLKRVNLLDLPVYALSSQVRHLQINDESIVSTLTDLIHSLDSPTGQVHLIAACGQYLGEQEAYARLVINYEDAPHRETILVPVG
jgi:hypothetical protein